MCRGLTARWRVDLIGKRLHHIGTVEAAIEREAVQIAIRELRIEPALRTKLMVTKSRGGIECRLR